MRSGVALNRHGHDGEYGECGDGAEAVVVRGMGSRFDVRGDAWAEAGFGASPCECDLGSGFVGRAEIGLVVVEKRHHDDDCASDDSPCTAWADDRSNRDHRRTGRDDEA